MYIIVAEKKREAKTFRFALVYTRRAVAIELSI
jgi:hypothetical protein